MGTGEACGTCGGDGKLINSFGSRATCPSCHGSGHRAEDTGFHDVTKTKPSHHRQSNVAAVTDKPQWPSTPQGAQLATEVKAATNLSLETKAKLTREIIEYEGTHGACTQTFAKKIRKQVRPRTP